MNLAIDIGNTRTKVAYFIEGKIEDTWSFSTGALENGLREVVHTFPADAQLKVGWISVAGDFDLRNYRIWEKFSLKPDFFFLDNKYPFPIKNLYITPETLGADRIVSVIGARSIDDSYAVLVVDAGTALTYDLANKHGEYLGGGISPGVEMRFRSLHTFTARLPLIHSQEKVPLIGNSTAACIRSGVLNGILMEVEGMVREYQKALGTDVKVYLSGGDLPIFENRLKISHVSDPNLILKGIDYILNHQA